jgi:hypothetical protein
VYGYKPASWHRRISLGLGLDYMAIEECVVEPTAGYAAEDS